jgi:hypothetical protein
MISLPTNPYRASYSDCPCCGYKKSLSASIKDGKPLYFCHAGCPQDSLWRVIQDEALLALHLEPKTLQRANLESRAYIQKLWDDSLSAVGTPVETYLRNRGFSGAVPASLHYLSKYRHSPSETFWPIMLASVTDWRGHLKAVHRTYLAREGKGKAPVEPAKMTLGAVGGLAVHLAPAGSRLAISEGIETGLSVQQISGLPTWAAISAGGMSQLILPPLPLAQDIIICADNDANSCGEKAAHNAAQRWLDEGRIVRITMPPIVGADFNDMTKIPVTEENYYAFT